MTVLFLLKTYTSTTSKPTSHISSSFTSYKGGYSQLLSRSRHGCLSVRQMSTLFWKIPRARPMRGGHHPHFKPKDKNHLNHHLKNYP